MEYDIVIIGGGVAGLSIAKFLKDSHYKIALMERKKDILNLSFFTLGSFLDYKKFGFSDKVVASPVNNCWFYSNNVKFKANIDSSLPVNILDKKQLHQELYESIKNSSNIDIYLSTSVVESVMINESVTKLKLSNAQEVKARIYIDCTGVAGVLSKKLGLMPERFGICTGLEYNVEYLGDPNSAYLMYGSYYAGGYGWIFPLGNKRAIFGIGSFNKKIKAELKPRLDKLIVSKDFKDLVKKDNDDAQGGTIPLTGVVNNFVKNNVIAIGDSVSNVNPLVGEGYRFIIEAASLAAQCIDEALKADDINVLDNYNTLWNKAYYSNYKYAKKLQKIADFGSHYGIIGDILTFFLKTKSSKTITRLMASEITKKDLLLP